MFPSLNRPSLKNEHCVCSSFQTTIIVDYIWITFFRRPQKRSGLVVVYCHIWTHCDDVYTLCFYQPYWQILLPTKPFCQHPPISQPNVPVLFFVFFYSQVSEKDHRDICGISKAAFTTFSTCPLTLGVSECVCVCLLPVLLDLTPASIL